MYRLRIPLKHGKMRKGKFQVQPRRILRWLIVGGTLSRSWGAGLAIVREDIEPFEMTGGCF